jgi:hypothetical protein
MDADTFEAHLLSAVLEVAAQQFYTTVYAVRQVLPPYYDTGPRNVEEEEPT